jgi:SNF2 family DNA or RNA helicase
MRSEGEIIWTYFTRNSKTHRWSVKKHARKAFFEFMASWSIYVRDPRHYGWRLNMPDLPPYETIRHTLAPTQQQIQFAAELTAEPTGQLHMFVDKATNTIERAKLSQIARGFRYVKDASGKKTRELIESVKPGYIADLVRSEVRSGHQVLVWTIFDAESDLILDRLQGLDGVEALTGRVPKSKRDPILERFRRGESPVLVSRAVMLGFGLNFQNCSSMVFSGWNDSFVAWYQAIRRAWRYGQNKTLRVHIPVIPELEGDMLENIFSKEDRHESDIREMEDNYISALHEISRTKEAEAAA